MKKIYIFAILSLIISNLKSQSFYGGLKFGGLISQVDGDSHGGYHKISPTGGIYVRNTFLSNQKWGASLELNYRNKGSNHSGKDETETRRELFAIDLHYIELPIMFNYKIDKFKLPSLFDYTLKNNLLVEFGPSVSYLIKGESYIYRQAQNDKEFRKIEVALNVGVTYYFAKRWFANYRFSYTFPFTPIKPHPGGQTRFLNRGQYNNCMSFSVGFEI
ncbi:MAG: PorT family protein [Bacteroidales bacterium]|jgi:hypothetical protein|nr:PorT family protein [Bacteroidales bacterium]